MLVIFDNGTPRTLARFLIDHHMVTEAEREAGKSWKTAISWIEPRPQASKFWLRRTRISLISRTSRAARLPLSYWVRGDGVSSSPTLPKLPQRSTRRRRAAMSKWKFLSTKSGYARANSAACRVTSSSVVFAGNRISLSGICSHAQPLRCRSLRCHSQIRKPSAFCEIDQ